MGEMLSAAEIERRLPAWCAMSDLFLDIELQPEDLRRIADALSGAGYSLPELRLILKREVIPAFGSNLLSVAGEWAGWGEAEVRDLMMRRLRRRPSPLWWVLGPMIGRMIAGEWREIERRIETAVSAHSLPSSRGASAA